MPKFIDITGKTINNWYIIKYIGNNIWSCRCTLCNNVYNVNGQSIRSGKSTMCKQCSNASKLVDLTGKTFGEWEVKYYCGGKRWMCQCSCGKLKEVDTARLQNGTSKSCGKHSNIVQCTDLLGNKFGKLYAESYLGNSLILCRCECSNIKIVYAGNLRNKSTVSCGCHKKSGDTHRLYTKDEFEKILSDITNDIQEKPFLSDIAKKLEIHEETVRRYVKKWELQSYINKSFRSRYEREIVDYIKLVTDYNLDIKINDRSVIYPYELDIYIPEKKLAIEFNGSYWHSTRDKNKYYHQNKTINCAKQGIQLIQIFEYEWNDSDTQEKIKQLINNCINKNMIRIFARNIEIKQLGNNDCSDFLNKYHLQGSVKSNINIGAFYNNKLVGVMTLGKPRFNSNYEYEIHRLCWENEYIVVGGTEKLFKYFLKNYNPKSIITYVDISKFTGNVYTRLGFKPIQPNPITEPNYVWVCTDNNTLLSRYQTKKHILIERGIGREDQTEDEIMSGIGYIKIYNSGNLKLSWNRE